MVSRRKLTMLAVLGFAALLVVAAAARADVVVARDASGRPIRFDVRDAGIDVEWFAAILRGAAHGDEIGRVVIRVVAPAAIHSQCGPGAAGCYHGDAAGGVIVVPSPRTSSTRHTLLHEYGHHLDAATPVAGVREPNGTPAWWAARGLEELSAQGLVARDYSRGWSRSVGEIFAEDYAQMHERFFYKIGWLEPPSGAVAEALRADLSGVPQTPVSRPVEIVRRGVIAAGQTRTLPFGLLGPGRRVTFSVALGARGQVASARVEIRCGTRRYVRRVGVDGRVTLARTGLGPAQCEVALVSTADHAQEYLARLRLGVPG